MATISHPVVSPYVFKTGTVTFKLEGATDVDDFSDHISEIGLTPSAQSGSWTGIGGNVISDQGIATWQAALGIVQDLDDAGLMRYLFVNEGTKAELSATFAEGTDVLKMTVVLSPSNIGGAVGSNPMSSSVNLTVDGKPQWITV